MKSFLILCVLVLCGTIGNAQTKRSLIKISTELAMKKKLSTDASSGTRGASVAWHPIQKKYYAVMAGNVKYPAAVFDANGIRLSSDNLTTMADCRGLWYNAVTKKIEGNQFSDYGWFAYILDAKGIPTDVEETQNEKCQPSDQCAGVYNTENNKVYFLSGSELYEYNASKCQVEGTIVIHFGKSKSQDISPDEDATVSPEYYNSSTLVYTGVKKAEFGFLNPDEGQIELYDKSTGLLTSILRLPSDAPMEEFFNFAYANGIFWLFDVEARKWVGYK